MNRELTEKWIGALRSGKYQQGKGYLRANNGTYCCLGVLCDIYNPDIWSPSEYGWIFDCHRTELPASLAKLIGISSKFETSLMNMNDERNKSFIQIADYIENILNSEVIHEIE